MNRLMSCVILAIALCHTANVAQARDLVVFAAASLKNVLDEAAEAFETSHDTRVTLSYAGSAALARQIQQGAPADIFVSAHDQWMDLLQDQALVRPDTRTVLAGNRLVLIAAQPGPVPLETAALRAAMGTDARLAMGHISAVPAGIYGKAALDALGLWAELSGSVVQTENVRAALRLVALGEAPFGIVYATDAQQEKRVHVAATFPPETHPPIRYPAALTAEGGHADAASFLRFLQGDQAGQIFAEHGFLPGSAP